MVSLAQLSHADIIGAKAGIDYWFYDGQLNRNQQNLNDQDLDQKVALSCRFLLNILYR